MAEAGRLFRSGTPLACRIGFGLHCPRDSFLTSADIVVSGAEGPDGALVGLHACVPLGLLGPDQLKQVRGLDTVLSGDDHVSVRHRRRHHGRITSTASATPARSPTADTKASGASFWDMTT